MGSIANINIADLIERFDTKIFVETGTGQGYSLLDSFNYSFAIRCSVEYHKEGFEALKANPLFNSVNLFNNTSVEGLKQILNYVPENEKILLWLDAHFANFSDFGNGSYFECMNNNKLNFPLEEEMKVIKELRPNNKDVIICDDLRIYEDGPFEGGNWPEREMFKIGNIDFAYDLFKDSHDIEKNYKDQGYLIITPKQ